MRIEEAIEVFAVDARMDGRAVGTIAKHRQEIRRYARWLESAGRDWCAASVADVQLCALV